MSVQFFGHRPGSHPSVWQVVTVVATVYTLYCMCFDSYEWIQTLQIRGGAGIEYWPQPEIVADIINGRVYWR